MYYTDILAAYEADAIDSISALEWADCGSIIELYEMAADEQDTTARTDGPDRKVA